MMPPMSCPGCASDMRLWGHEHEGYVICTRCEKQVGRHQRCNGCGKNNWISSCGAGKPVCGSCGQALHGVPFGCSGAAQKSGVKEIVGFPAVRSPARREEARHVGERPSVTPAASGCIVTMAFWLAFVMSAIGAWSSRCEGQRSVIVRVGNHEIARQEIVLRSHLLEEVTQ